MRVIVTQIADGRILADVEIEVATPSRGHKGAVNGGCPDDFAFEEALDVFENRVAIIAGFGKFGISVGAQQNGIRAVDPNQSQLA